MLKYVIRRVLYMIPTVLGVILLTFVLFNVAAGDPARMKLGKQAKARMLEDYDVIRGYNKPLILGVWGSTRADFDQDLGAAGGAWLKLDGVEYEAEPRGHVRLSDGWTNAIPVAFELYAGERYRWRLTYRLDDGDAPGEPTASLAVEGCKAGTVRRDLVPGGRWRRVELEFESGTNTSALVSRLDVAGGDLRLSDVELQLRAKHAFDSQLVFYICQIARFDFGVSHETNQRVSTMIKDGILPSLALTVPMFIAGLLVSISLALVCAFFRNTFIDRFFVVTSVVLMSVNYLVWIVFGQYMLGYVSRQFPVWGFESWEYLALPWLIGVVSGLGGSLRFYRTVMLDEMYRDYVRTAFAKGVGKRTVLFKHVLKNAMIPILTSVVMTIPFLYTGSLLLESFFGIPGLGTISINAINSADADVIRAVVFVGAMIYVVANLVTDISYTLVDPRVKLK